MVAFLVFLFLNASWLTRKSTSSDRGLSTLRQPQAQQTDVIKMGGVV